MATQQGGPAQGGSGGWLNGIKIIAVLICILVILALIQGATINKIGFGSFSINFGHDNHQRHASARTGSGNANPPGVASAKKFEFTNLSPKGVTPEPCAFVVKGRGAPGAGLKLVISNQEVGTGKGIDPLLHFGPAISKPVSDLWYANVQIGIPRTKPHTKYAIVGWLVSDAWVRHRVHVAKHAWWSAGKLPPGTTKVLVATVSRKGYEHCNH